MSVPLPSLQKPEENVDIGSFSLRVQRTSPFPSFFLLLLFGPSGLLGFFPLFLLLLLLVLVPSSDFRRSIKSHLRGGKRRRERRKRRKREEGASIEWLLLLLLSPSKEKEATDYRFKKAKRGGERKARRRTRCQTAAKKWLKEGVGEEPTILLVPLYLPTHRFFPTTKAKCEEWTHHGEAEGVGVEIGAQGHDGAGVQELPAGIKK